MVNIALVFAIAVFICLVLVVFYILYGDMQHIKEWMTEVEHDGKKNAQKLAELDNIMGDMIIDFDTKLKRKEDKWTVTMDDMFEGLLVRKEDKSNDEDDYDPDWDEE